MEEDKLKQIILDRYCDQFTPAASQDDATITKTSEDIVNDLRPMADFTRYEVSKHLIENGYELGMNEDTPVWMMKEYNPYRND